MGISHRIFLPAHRSALQRSFDQAPPPGRDLLRRCVQTRSCRSSSPYWELPLGFEGFGEAHVTLPALVFQFYMFDRDRVGAGIEIGKRLVFGDPAAIENVT